MLKVQLLNSRRTSLAERHEILKPAFSNITLKEKWILIRMQQEQKIKQEDNKQQHVEVLASGLSKLTLRERGTIHKEIGQVLQIE